MSAVAKKANVVHSTVAKKAPAVKVPTAKKGVVKNVDGVANKTVAAKGVPVKGAKTPAKRVPAGKASLSETLPTSEALPMPAEVVLSDPPGY